MLALLSTLALTLVLSATAAPLATQVSPDPALPTQANFDAAAYQGFWYEVYSIPQSDEALCTCTASNFTMKAAPDQWEDKNFCHRLGSMESVPLTMYQLDRAHPERLAIGMAPWLTFTKMWVMKTDYTSYSLVGDPSRKALWLYGRHAGLDRETYTNLTEYASELGYDVTKLKMVDHSGDCRYNGIPTPDIAMENEVEVQAAPVMDCSFADPSTYTIDLSRCPTCSGNVKIRTCRTGVGCTGDKGQWNSFKDCEYDIGPSQNITLSFEQKVEYFVFYNTGSAATDEFWRPKTGPWPTSHIITV